MRLFLAILAGSPDNKAVFKAANQDEARLLALAAGYVIVEEV